MKKQREFYSLTIDYFDKFLYNNRDICAENFGFSSRYGRGNLPFLEAGGGVQPSLQKGTVVSERKS